MISVLVLVRLCVCTVLLDCISGITIPKIKPKGYKMGHVLKIESLKISSVTRHITHDFYYSPLHCKPKDGVEFKSQSIGQDLIGDRLVDTNFIISMGVNQSCKVVCPPQDFSRLQSQQLINLIQDEFRVHLQIDGLPCVSPGRHSQKSHMEVGYRLGQAELVEGKLETIVHNHLQFILKYRYNDNRMEVTSFIVNPNSVQFQKTDTSGGCSIPSAIPAAKLDSFGNNHLALTYEVLWFEDTASTSRLDPYLYSHNTHMQWISIANSLFLVVTLAGILTLGLMRSLGRDINAYNRMKDDEFIEEMGWKLSHGDVFRNPIRPVLLTTLVGSGTQLVLMTVSVLVLTLCGLISSSIRGSMITSAIVAYILSGSLSAYWSGRLYKTIGGVHWWKTAAGTASFFPASALLVLVSINLVSFQTQTSSVPSIQRLVYMSFLWLLFSLPIVTSGFFFGYRHMPYEYPTRTNKIPRQIPDQPKYLGFPYNAAICGILPFGVMFIQLRFMFQSLWEDQPFVLFGFLTFSVIICLATIAVTSAGFTYLVLQKEDYRWWWKSILGPAGMSLHALLYSIVYYFRMSHLVGFTTALIYFGYSLLISIAVFLMSGSLGFWSSFYFVRKIFAYVKIQ